MGVRHLTGPCYHHWRANQALGRQALGMEFPGAPSDIGIRDEFMAERASTMKPDSSALIVLESQAAADSLWEEVRAPGTGQCWMRLTCLLRQRLPQEDLSKHPRSGSRRCG